MIVWSKQLNCYLILLHKKSVIWCIEKFYLYKFHNPNLISVINYPQELLFYGKYDDSSNCIGLDFCSSINLKDATNLIMASITQLIAACVKYILTRLLFIYSVMVRYAMWICLSINNVELISDQARIEWSSSRLGKPANGTDDIDYSQVSSRTRHYIIYSL